MSAQEDLFGLTLLLNTTDKRRIKKSVSNEEDTRMDDIVNNFRLTIIQRLNSYDPRVKPVDAVDHYLHAIWLNEIYGDKPIHCAQKND
jgi:hypothetical protein